MDSLPGEQGKRRRIIYFKPLVISNGTFEVTQGSDTGKAKPKGNGNRTTKFFNGIDCEKLIADGGSNNNKKQIRIIACIICMK